MVENNSVQDLLVKIVKKLEDVERKGKENDPKYMEWISKISEPSFSMINNLLVYFMDELTSQIDREKIIKVLLKLLQLKNDVVKPQLLESTDLPIVVSSYITKSDKTKMSQNAFSLLTQLFVEENFQTMINEEFVKALFDGLTIISEEELLQSVVCILIDINTVCRDEEVGNIILKVHHENENSRVLDELLLRIFNGEKNIDKILNILTLMNKLMEFENGPIFYESDIQSFLDIIINKLQETFNEEFKTALLFALENITKFDIYYHEKYKFDELVELMQDFMNHDGQSDEVKSKCEGIAQNLKNHE